MSWRLPRCGAPGASPCSPADSVGAEPRSRCPNARVSLIAALASLLGCLSPLAAPPALLLGGLSLLAAGPALAQTAPSLGVESGGGWLYLYWNDLVTRFPNTRDYYVHYTSAPASGNGSVANSATASGNDPSKAWVAVERTNRLSPRQLISGLAPGTAYRVRVAANTTGWTFGTGTPTQEPTQSVKPRNLVVSKVTNDYMELSWEDPAEVVVTKSVGGAETYRLAKIPGAAISSYEISIRESGGDVLETVLLKNKFFKRKSKESGGYLKHGKTYTISVRSRYTGVYNVPGSSLNGRQTIKPIYGKSKWVSTNVKFNEAPRRLTLKVNGIAQEDNATVSVDEGATVTVTADIGGKAPDGGWFVDLTATGSAKPYCSSPDWDWTTGDNFCPDGKALKVIPAGGTQVSTTIRTLRDTNEEGTETIVLRAVAGRNTSHPNQERTVILVIQDQYDVHRLSVQTTHLSTGRESPREDGAPSNVGQVGFLVTLSPPSSSTVTVDYRTEDYVDGFPGAGPPATAGSDYTSTSGTLTFAPGETSKWVYVPILDDTIEDSGETFWLVLSNPQGAMLVRPEGLGLILNHEAAVPTDTPPPSSSPSDTSPTSSSDSASVSLLATPNPVGEGSPVTVRATVSEALSEAVTIPLTVTRGTAESGDHGSLASITLPAGFTSATGTLPTFEDDDGEDETFTLALGSLPAGLTAGSASSVEVTITDSGLQQSTEQLTEEGKRKYGPSPTASGPDGETLLVGFGQIAQTLPEVSIELDGDGPSTISEGEAARFRVSRTGSTTAPLSVNLVVRENQAEGQDFLASGNEGNKTITIPAGQRSTPYTVPTEEDNRDEPDGAITATVTAGTDYTLSDSGNTAEVEVRDDDAPVAAPPTEEKRAWHVRFGRSVSQQVVDALQQRFSTTTTPSGLQLTVAGETLTSDTPLEENHVLLSRLLGFESVSSQELAQGSSFSFSPDGAGPRLSFWGKGAFSSFNGVEESITLTGEVTTALVGAEWSNERWQAGAALSHSWGNGSYQGEGDGADGRISSTLTGVFPYGRYALTPRLGVWATAGYGWGSLSLNPDGDAPEYNPATTMALGAVGMDGLLLDGGSEGVTLTTTADALFLKTSSEAVEGLASSEGNISRLRLGLEASRAFPLANGASLSPSLEVGLRQDSGDAETGFGMDLGAGLSWSAPQQGITATVKGRTLLSHGAEDFQDQGLALSFSWQPSPSNRGASLSLSHAVGLPAEGGMAALLNPTAIEVLDEPHSSGERFEARLAYGFPFYNDRLTLSPAVATALSPSSRTYSLLWSLAPYHEHFHAEPWELSLEGERQENLSSPTVDHSLKLRFALPL